MMRSRDWRLSKSKIVSLLLLLGAVKTARCETKQRHDLSRRGERIREIQAAEQRDNALLNVIPARNIDSNSILGRESEKTARRRRIQEEDNDPPADDPEAPEAEPDLNPGDLKGEQTGEGGDDDTTKSCEQAKSCGQCKEIGSKLDETKTCLWKKNALDGDNFVCVTADAEEKNESMCSETPKKEEKAPSGQQTDAEENKPSKPEDKKDWGRGLIVGLVAVLVIILVMAGVRCGKSCKRTAPTQSQYQGVATQESNDDDDWDWDTSHDETDVELSGVRQDPDDTPIGTSRSLSEGSHKKKEIVASDSGKLKLKHRGSGSSTGGGGGTLSPSMSSQVSPAAGSASSKPDLPNQRTPNAAKNTAKTKCQDDDIFAEMGFSAKPTFSNAGWSPAAGVSSSTPSGLSRWQAAAATVATGRPATRNLGATSIPLGDDDILEDATDEWGDDADLDDLLND